MKNLSKGFAVVAAAGLVIAGGSAFTAQNTVPANVGAGYGSTTTNGIVADTMAVNLGEDHQSLTSVVYTAGPEDVSTLAGWTYLLSTNDGATLLTETCTALFDEVAEPDKTTITCEPDDPTDIDDVTNLGLTATKAPGA